MQAYSRESTPQINQHRNQQYSQPQSRQRDNHIAAPGLNQHIPKTGAENMNKVAVMPASYETSNIASHFNPKQIDILKNSICKGVTNDEFEVFLMACVKTKLDPFMRQIYAVKRKAKLPNGSWGETMTIQTGIDGYRLIAERTERYAPGVEPTYTYDEKGGLLSATAYIKKQTADGTWHLVSSSAYIDEYCQTFTDRATGEKKASGMWGNMPRTMLAKCAEAQALRKAFPAEMSGVYTKEEMQQADPIDVTPIYSTTKITLEQAQELNMILDECDINYKRWFIKNIKQVYNIERLSELTVDAFNQLKIAATKNMEEHRAKQKETYEQPETINIEAL